MDFVKLSVFLLILAVSGVLSLPTPAEVTPEKTEGSLRDARSPTPDDLETSETFLFGGYGLGLGYGLGWGGYGLGYGGWGGYGWPYGYGYGIYG